MDPSSCPSLSSAFYLAGRQISKHPAAAQKTKQQQALTQAPSTKQSKSKPVAAQRQAAWLGLVASGWLLASTSPTAAKVSKPVAQKTQQQRALTQAANTSTRQSKSKPVAAQRQAASGFCLAGRQSF
jgi:hypothetical protein